MNRHQQSLLLMAIVLFTSTSCKQDLQNSDREAVFKPFRHTFNIEQLHEEFSSSMMAEAKNDWNEMAEVNKKGKYKPDIESIG